MLSTDNWCIKVAERVYGPYTTGQLSSFANEGRISAQSMVSPAGSKSWRAAHQFPAIAELLGGGDMNVSRRSSFGKHSDTAHNSKLEEGAVANFIIIFDVVSGAATRLEHIIRNIGPAFRITDNVWAVSSEQTIMGLKNTLAPHLQIREPIFVIDTSRGKSAWQNFTPHTHSKLTKTWVKG